MVGSMEPTIRLVTPDDMPDFVRAMNASMFEQLDPESVGAEIASNWQLDRVWAAFDGKRLVGTFRSFGTELTVPGCARLPGTALSSVSVRPDYRRQGILRGMVAAEHAAARDRGEAVGLLYASEYPIYGRFGYGPACVEATWSLDSRATAFLGDASGSVEIVPADTASRDASIAVFEAWRARSPGEIRRIDYRWDYQFGIRVSGDEAWNGFVALHRDAAGAVDGYVRYKVEERWELRQPRATLTVEELHGVDRAAEAELWRFLAGIDWVSTVVANRRSRADPLPWLLLNARAAHITEAGDGLWVRLLDVQRALETRTYERAGSLVLDVVDDEAAGGRSRVLLDASQDGATCRPTDRSPDLSLHVSALGAAYLGGSPLRFAVRARGADEHRPGALAEADALFRTIDEPWCSTFF
jgi:predicted acetyltransferase